MTAPALPGFGFSWVDPSTLTTIRRITRYESAWGWYPHHAYSKIQPWNIDGSLIKRYSVAVWDAVTHRVVRELPGDLFPSFWSNTDPDLIFSFREDGTIKTYSVSSGEETVLDRIEGYDLVVLGPGEGNMDDHDRYVALAGKDGQDMDVIVYDLQHARTVSTRRFPGAWGSGGSMPEHVDWVSISQSGAYVVILWNSGPPWDVHPFDGHFGVEVYDPGTLAFQRRLVHYGDHGDLGFLTSGAEAYVQFWGENGTINAYELGTGQVTVIHTDPDFGVGDAHLSCRNILRPGWAYVSTDPSHGGMVLAVKLDGSETVEPFGHHLSSAASYLKSPMPVPSPDGMRVMFKSDFGDAGDADVVYDFEAWSSDAVLLYRNDSEVEITVGTGPAGGPTFDAVRSDGTPLRTSFSGEQFFEDHSMGVLSIDWNIEERPGGVQIRYTISNPSGAPQPMPDLQIQGLGYRARERDDALWILNTATHQYLHRRELMEPGFLGEDGQFQGFGRFDVNGMDDMPYPLVYAPVIVAHDGEFAAGSSLNVNFPAQGLAPRMEVVLEPDGRWSHVFRFQGSGQTVEPGATVHLSVDLRFAPPRFWLVTLSPYRLLFEGWYGEGRRPTPRDTRPVSAVNLSYDTVAWEQYQACLEAGACPADGSSPPGSTIVDWNLRGYNWYLRLDRYGLDGPNPDHGDQGFVGAYLARLQEAGFQRAVLWTLSGQYWWCPQEWVIPGDHPSCGTNFPHQILSDLLPALDASTGELDRFGEQGIELGLWWGRAGQVPEPRQWNPDAVVPLDPGIPEHVAFAEHELTLALGHGVRILGLDAFPNMNPEDQLDWLRHLSDLAPGVELWSEGSVTDYLHTCAALFLQPENPGAAGPLAGTPIQEPALLPAYLNPGAEILVYLAHRSDPGFPAELQRLVSLGYTPVVVAHPDIFDVPLVAVGDLDPAPSPCCNGLDDDGDGLADFPFDPGCTDPLDWSELVGPAGMLDEVAEILDLDGTAATDAGGGSHPGTTAYDVNGDALISAADLAALVPALTRPAG